MSARALADLVTLCHAYLHRMNPAHAFSHATAAVLYGIPLPNYASSGLLEVSAPEPLRRPRGAGILGHEIASELWDARTLVLPYEHVGQFVGLPIVSPELAWAQLASVLDAHDLVAAADAAVTLQHPGIGEEGPLSTPTALRRVVETHRARRGVVGLSRAVDQMRAGPLSRPESLLRVMVMRAGFPEPQLNVPVVGSDGRIVATPDLRWPEYRVLIEYEGGGHRTSTAKFRSDITRGELYADAGWFQLRAHAEDVFDDPNPFLGRLGRRMAERGWRSPRRGLRHMLPARR